MTGPSGGSNARLLTEGQARGQVLRLDEPLSFWGGVDPGTGRIVDAHHPQAGRSVQGRILVMPSGRGSCSSSSMLAESIRMGTAPAAIVLRAPDEILLVGAAVAGALYGLAVPVVVVDEDVYATLRDGDTVEVEARGTWMRVYRLV